MNDFSSIPKDPDTKIIEQSEIKINDIPAINQKWSWDGIKASSLVFHSKDVEEFNDDELLELIKESGIEINSSVTFSNKSEFRFVNYNFEVS